MALEKSLPRSFNTYMRPGLIEEYVPLADKNWFKTGGSARFYCAPTTPLEFQQALAFADTQSLKICMLGEGANVLISDEGFDGLVLRPAMQELREKPVDGNHCLVYAGAGVSFQKLIDWCLSNNLVGLEEFSGIPGTVGGSVFINIHYFEHLLSEFLVEGQVIHKTTGELLTVPHAWFNFGYNYSTLHENNYYLVSATFKLKKVDTVQAAYARGRSDETIRHRHKRYPTINTCGSFFRNFHENEVTLISGGKKLIYVAYYLDKIGVKGELSVGNAGVSYQHANMIVHTGTTTTQDIVTLARTMQELVLQKFGILPQPECRLIGFKNYPLLQL
ncbi:UDP-N-acetylmuramate dehydrogenase [Candidatus Dependentiae bacterium]|nr:UDP-N-acetylmuramate dehydrogenase [Candidatus Dependentiae bacterium]